MISAADDLFACATRRAAEALDELTRQGVKELGEKKHLEPAFRQALRECGAPWVDDSATKLPLPNWLPKPGGPDVCVSQEPFGRASYVGELKLRKTEETLWDFYKMIDALNLPGVEEAYMIVGAAEAWWEKQAPNACAELFQAGGLRIRSVDLFTKNRCAWFHLLLGGKARPTAVPAEVGTRLVSSCEFEIDGAPGSLRCVAVEAVAGQRLLFTGNDGDWPAGVDPC